MPKAEKGVKQRERERERYMERKRDAEIWTERRGVNKKDV